MKNIRLWLTGVGIVLLGGTLFYACGSRDRDKGFKVYTVRGKGGMVARFCENGARLMSLTVPGRDGKLVDVVVGFADPADYEKSTEPYFGATVGRYGNRIAGGRFSLGGKVYHIPVNNGINALHGGKMGFQSKRWKLEQVGDSSLVCSLVSPDGDSGFPGELKVRVVYTLRADNSLEMDYRAVSDKPTVVNLTNHAFFNLNGGGSILGHQLMINAGSFTPVDSVLIPNGELRSVKATPFDFRISKAIGRDIGAADEQLRFGRGYDHNFVLNRSRMMPAVSVVGDKSGIRMEVYTTEPGLQFYSGNFMKGENALRNGKDAFRTAFCLETQHFPDSPNRWWFPSTLLNPGKVYRSRSVYAFSVDR